MKKGALIGSVLALIISSTAPALGAPTAGYGDVPAKHWSFDAVSYLAQAGIIDGYGDNTFRGDKSISRYEMAQVVYKAMLNQSKANIAQKALIDKLASEYALEMNKIQTIDTRLTKVEQNQPTVKFSGSLLAQYKVKSYELPNNTGWASGQAQFRLNATAQVDKDTTLGLRLANPAPKADKFKDSTANYFGDNADNSLKADRFFATTKTGVTAITIGRQAMAVDQEDIIVDSGFFSYDGIKITTKWSGLDFDIKRGRFARNVTGYTFGNGVTTNNTDFNNIYNDSIAVGSKTGKLNWNVSWAKFSNNALANKTLMNYSLANLGYGFNDKFSMATEIGKNTADNGGSFWMLKGVYGAQSLNAPGKQNFTAQYLHAGNNSVNGVYTSFDQPTEDGNNGTNGHAWNNLDLAYRYAFSKNMTGKMEYSKVTDKIDATQSYHVWKLQFLYKY